MNYIDFPDDRLIVLTSEMSYLLYLRKELIQSYMLVMNVIFTS